ncbi:DUF3237 domain-containing protein [Pseudomonas sp. M5]|jgi:hypothetical protein|uniref:DUF3237 domain-containing protein n=1 Tax=Pseudomonas sp. M5 TaxID=1620788 RepID=UPI00195F1165|nr:DUF3237 domain-containing protein [Pseudomonas sp. M5]MBM7396389.1 hypothetical protein [Pseudomonas sp. M5]HDS1754620.1 DUF3237 domain-containing protein [Pseudomonas putida]
MLNTSMITPLTLAALLASPAALATEAPPRLVPVYEAIVDIAPSQALGKGPLGERFIVPILGGEFHGPGLEGKVLPGGADRQLVRTDGVKQLDALYELQTSDGAVLTVRNQVMVHNLDPDRRYAFSHVSIEAPRGPYAGLSQAILVGSLTSLKPARNAVSIKVYRVE